MKTFQLQFKFVFISVVVIFSMLLCVGWTAKRDVSLRDFLKELTVVNVKGNQTQSVVWLPFEFNVKAIGDDVKKQVDSSLKSYLIFMVTCSVDHDGSRTCASWSQIQNRAFLKGISAAPLKPLTMVPVELSQKLEVIKTAVTDSGGSTADSHMIIFDVNDPNGKALVDTAKRDKLTLVLEASDSFSKVQFTWHTPFDALIDAGTCSKCGEKVRAYWYYCPSCGNKL
jgi:hypothetical protein